MTGFSSYLYGREINNFPSTSIGWLAVATGIIAAFALIFIAAFFSVGQPFGSLNDICIGLTAILSAILIWTLYPRLHAQSPLLSQIMLATATLGALLVLIGSALAISGIKGWFLSGLYMAAGNAMLGVCLLGLSYLALRDNSLPRGLIVFGFVCGVIMALGLAAIPGIFRGMDTQEYELTVFNYAWWAGSLGYLILYPIWCILLGRLILSGNSS